MKQLGMKKNFILSTLYQILTLLTPLVTAPYISRVLGGDGVGIYSYTNSYQLYFSMFAALGTVSYGAREIARNRNDKKTYSRLFWEIELLTVMTSAVCLLAWGVFILFQKKYQIYYIILTMNLVATMFDISWFFTGLEQFRCTVTQNTIFKLLGIAALFIFVRDKNDIAIYIGIMAAVTMLGNLSMWLYLPSFLTKVEGRLHFKTHFKETMIYFIPTIATSIYTVLDKTLIGLITEDEYENGYYEQATKIINMAKAVTFTALNSVFGARISYLFAEEQYEEIHKKMEQSVSYILFMGVAICFGLIGVSGHFVPLFFGAEYGKVIPLLWLFSPIVLIIGISNCLGTQYYTPAGLRKISARFIIIGSVVNLVFNLILIPRLASYGAVIASVIAETVIMVLYLIYCKGYVTVKMLLRHIWKKLIAGALMLLVIFVIGRLIANDLAAVVVQVAAGIVVYCGVLMILKDSFLYDIALPMVRKRIHK